MNPERDTKIRELAYDVSVTLKDQPLDVAVAAAALWMVTQLDVANNSELNWYVIDKLSRVTTMLTRHEQEKGQ